MSAAVRKVKSSRVIVIPPARRDVQSAKFMPLAELRKLTECEQVAAVCYRVRRGKIEFLLVRTRGSGRWTFPKGRAEPGLTQAQAAALEAFEEAGVHGRIEETSFARYCCGTATRKSKARPAARSIRGDVVINAFLCEVTRLCAPKESGRNRTWFSAQAAKLSLREGREKAEGAAFARVVDKAAARIERLLNDAADSAASGMRGAKESASERDGLRKVQFEAFRPETSRLRSVLSKRQTSYRLDEGASTLAQQGDILPFRTPPALIRGPKLLAAAKRDRGLGGK